MEIGSYFLLEERTGQSSNTLDYYLNQFAQKKTYFDSGRSAIRYLCNVTRKKTVLLPNYLCDSIIQPFLEGNFKIIFYEVNNNLEPVIDRIYFDDSIGVFFHLGYFGRRSTERLQEIIILMRKMGIIVIEDITHSVFSTAKSKLESDYYICSIRKWLGIPDGGILLSNSKIEFTNTKVNTELIANYSEGSSMKKEYLDKRNYSSSHLNYYKIAEKSLDLSKDMFSISNYSKEVLYHYDFANMVSIRRKNATYLTKEILKLGLKTLDLNNNNLITPLFVPIFFKDKEERDLFKLCLVDSNIYTPVHWSKPNNMNIDNNIYNIELSIPCDQRYTIQDMKLITNKIKSIMERIND